MSFISRYQLENTPRPPREETGVKRPGVCSPSANSRERAAASAAWADPDVAMADERARIDAELDNLRSKEAALKAAGKTAELKALAKRKGDLKLMKKKGISPDIAPPRSSSRLLPSLSSGMPSMAAAMTMPPVPKWVSEFPNFTPPTEDDAAEFAGRPLGLGCSAR